jgi:transcriptional regulator with XRE-family HTH domain
MRRQLAELLRRWRAQRGVSLSALARHAGIAKGTLSGWEGGLHWPRLPELDAVLTALEVSPTERREALALIGAPRAERSLALLSAAVSGGLEARTNRCRATCSRRCACGAA